MAESSEQPGMWLVKKYFEEWSVYFRTVWQLYISFYVAFLAMNSAAIGLTVQYVTSTQGKMVIAIVFIFQNTLAAMTAAFISRYCASVATQIQSINACQDFKLDALDGSAKEVLRRNPVPVELAQWGLRANIVGHIVFIALWAFVVSTDFK